MFSRLFYQLPSVDRELSPESLSSLEEIENLILGIEDDPRVFLHDSLDRILSLAQDVESCNPGASVIMQVPGNPGVYFRSSGQFFL